MKKVTICAAVSAIFVCEDMSEKTSISVEQDNLSEQSGNFEKVVSRKVTVDSDFAEINEKVSNKCSWKSALKIGELIWKN